MTKSDWSKLRIELLVSTYTTYSGEVVTICGLNGITVLDYDDKTEYLHNLINKTKKTLSDKLDKIRNKYDPYSYEETKEVTAEYLLSFITETKSKHLNGKPVTKTDITEIFDNLKNQLPASPDDFVGRVGYLDILVPIQEKIYTCNLEISTSAELDNFIKNKQKFLETYQVGSDEFAYDYEDYITKGAKSIFGEDRIKMAIYDFGGDSDDFKILIELLTNNEEENEGYFYFIDRSNKYLPEEITVQSCLKMQDYSYNLVKELYDSYKSNFQTEEV